LIKILGPCDTSSFSWVNLDSTDTWYDTYVFILNRWKSSLKENFFSQKILAFFQRSSIKPTTMRHEYGGVRRECFKTFLSEIEDSQEFLSLNNDERKMLEDAFYSFFAYLETFDGFFASPSSLIIDRMKKLKNLMTLVDGSFANLNYYELVKRQINFISPQKERMAKVFMIRSNILNMKKIMQATRANVVHVIDAALIRFIISIIPTPPIHDCILIDPRDVNFLLALVNEGMNKTFFDLKIANWEEKKTLFSSFIFL
jgi:hypothetical protein